MSKHVKLLIDETKVSYRTGVSKVDKIFIRFSIKSSYNNFIIAFIFSHSFNQLIKDRHKKINSLLFPYKCTSALKVNPNSIVIEFKIIVLPSLSKDYRTMIRMFEIAINEAISYLINGECEEIVNRSKDMYLIYIQRLQEYNMRYALNYLLWKVTKSFVFENILGISKSQHIIKLKKINLNVNYSNLFINPPSYVFITENESKLLSTITDTFIELKYFNDYKNWNILKLKNGFTETFYTQNSIGSIVIGVFPKGGTFGSVLSINYILGKLINQSSTSILYKKLRVENKYSYSIFSKVVTSVNGFIYGCTCEKSNIDIVKKILKKIIINLLEELDDSLFVYIKNDLIYDLKYSISAGEAEDLTNIKILEKGYRYTDIFDEIINTKIDDLKNYIEDNSLLASIIMK